MAQMDVEVLGQPKEVTVYASLCGLVLHTG